MGFLSKIFGKKNEPIVTPAPVAASEQVIAQPIPKLNNNDVIGGGVFVVEDVFAISGKGIIATGELTSGRLATGENVVISNDKHVVIANSTILRIEQFRKTINEVKVGEKAGLLLGDIKREDVKQGYIISR